MKNVYDDVYDFDDIYDEDDYIEDYKNKFARPRLWDGRTLNSSLDVDPYLLIDEGDSYGNGDL